MSNEDLRQNTTADGYREPEPDATMSRRAERRRQAAAERLAEIVPYQFHTKEVRTVYRDGQVWFVADDVYRVLDLSNGSEALNRLDTDERGHLQIQTGGISRRMGTINESGLFALVLGSNKPEPGSFGGGSHRRFFRRSGGREAMVNSQHQIQRPTTAISPTSSTDALGSI